MGLISILLGGLIIVFASFYLINNLFLTGSNLNKNPSSITQTPMDQAKDTQIISDFQSIQKSLNLYKAQKGQYPDNLQKLSDENLIHSTFKNPFTQTEYKYQVTGDKYTLSTNLGSGKPYQVGN